MDINFIAYQNPLLDITDRVFYKEWWLYGALTVQTGVAMVAGISAIGTLVAA